MNIGFDAAAKGAPEMAFWPTAASAYIYSNCPSVINLSLTCLLMFTGAMTYLSMRQVKQLVDSVKNKSQTRRDVGRDSETLLQKGIFSDAAKTAQEVLPNNRYVFVLVVLCIMVDFVAGGLLLMTLLSDILSLSRPSVAPVILASMPTIYLFIIFSIFIWQIGS